jgi:hypothetical protein
MLRMAIQTSRFRIGVLCMHTNARPFRWFMALQAKLRCIAAGKCLWPDDALRISGFGMASACSMAFFAAPPLRSGLRPGRLAMWILGKARANLFVAAHAGFRTHVLRRVFRRWRFVLRRGQQRHTGKHQCHPPKLKLRHHLVYGFKGYGFKITFPNCSPFSSLSWAAAASRRGKLLSTTGFSLPLKTCRSTS